MVSILVSPALPVAGLSLFLPLVSLGALPAGPSLSGLKAVGEIVVTSDRSADDEEVLHSVVATRLERAGIGVDPGVKSALQVSVFAARDTAPDGIRHFLYLVTLSFQEPVRAERSPHEVFRATTWSRHVRVSRFGSDVSLQSIADQVESTMAAFVMAVNQSRSANGKDGDADPP